MNVKERIIRYLKFHKIKQGEFCEQIGVAKTYINSIRSSISPEKLSIIGEVYPDLNIEWLLTGEGSMLKGEDTQTTVAEGTDYRLVPMYNLDARGGFADNLELCSEYIIDHIPFKDAKNEDICIPISGDSMSPTYRAGSIVLLHRVEDWFEFLELGQVYVIELRDGRRLIKELRRSEEDSKNNYLCISHNPMFEPVELPKKLIIRVYLVRAVYAKTSM